MADSLVQLGIQLTRIISPMIIIVGVVGNLLNIAVLTRPALHHHACSRYFLALASNNLFYSGVILIYNLLSNGYHISASNNSVSACKIMTYISTLTVFLAPYLIVFASIDRYWASSINVRIRNLSCTRVAQWMIISLVTVFALVFINVLVFADSPQNRGSICALQANTTYSQVYVIIQVFLFAAVPPSLMILFGLMTIHNANQLPVTAVKLSRYHRTERQLARMLLLQVSVHILLTLPFSVIYLISVLSKTIPSPTIFPFISQVLQLCFNCSYVTSFFLYILSGRIYRKELLLLVHRKFRIYGGNQIQPSANQNTVVPLASKIHPQVIASRY